MIQAEKGDWREMLLKASGFSAEEVKESAAQDGVNPTDVVPKKKKEKLNIFVEKKGRGGKTATIVVGFQCSDEELKEIASRLKNSLGCGGSCRDGEILLQGNRREEVMPLLRTMGYML